MDRLCLFTSIKNLQDLQTTALTKIDNKNDILKKSKKKKKDNGRR